jgi:hypothetical protein
LLVVVTVGPTFRPNDVRTTIGPGVHWRIFHVRRRRFIRRRLWCLIGIILALILQSP